MCEKDSDSAGDETSLFHAAMRDVTPLSKIDKIVPRHQPVPPIPRKRNDPQQIAETLSDHISTEIEAGDEWSYARAGMPHQTLRRLRRGHWRIQASLDLHGLTRDEARQELSVFLEASLNKKLRCVRVIHGKGLSSKNRTPVLKTKVGNWLLQHVYVLAFCQAKPEDGGSGAMLILLKASE